MGGLWIIVIEINDWQITLRFIQVHAVLNKHKTKGAKHKSEMVLFAQAFVFMLKVAERTPDYYL